MFRTILLLPAILSIIGFVSAKLQGNPGDVVGSRVAMDGEEYVYEVRWTWFKLGTIRLQTLSGGKAEAFIDSAPNIPFVNLHSVHYTTMDSMFYSHASYSMEKEDDVWKGMNYVYDLPEKLLYVEDVTWKSPHDQPVMRAMKDTLRLPSSSFLDGLSIAYFPRRFIHADSTVTMPTVLYGKLGETTFFFRDKHTTESIDAVDNPVRVIEFDGYTTAVGIYGMTGEFTGWFSDDEAAVPIRGKLKVLVGNVTVELVSWHRAGWNPPQ